MTFRHLLKSLQEISPVMFPIGMAIWIKKEEPLTPESTHPGLMWADMEDTEDWEIWCPLTHDNLWDCLENNLDINWLRALWYDAPPMIRFKVGFELEPGYYIVNDEYRPQRTTRLHPDDWKPEYRLQEAI